MPARKKYWLLKSEPEVFSIDDLKKRPQATEPWDGVRNYQARNFLRDDMKKGDLAFFYHSKCDQPGIVGIIEVTREAYPDPLAFDPKSNYYDPKSDPESPRWFCVDVTFREAFPATLTLHAMKSVVALKDMVVLRKGNRLSVMPVTKKEFDSVTRLARKAVS